AAACESSITPATPGAARAASTCDAAPVDGLAPRRPTPPARAPNRRRHCTRVNTRASHETYMHVHDPGSGQRHRHARAPDAPHGRHATVTLLAVGLLLRALPRTGSSRPPRSVRDPRRPLQAAHGNRGTCG